MQCAFFERWCYFFGRKSMCSPCVQGQNNNFISKHPNPQPNPFLPSLIADWNFPRILAWETRIPMNKITNLMVIEIKLKKIYQKNKNIIKKTLELIQIVSYSKFMKEKNRLIFSSTKQSAKIHKNNNNQTNLTQQRNHTIHVYNTEWGLGLGFVFMLWFCFRVRVLFWCFRKLGEILKKF